MNNHLKIGDIILATDPDSYSGSPENTAIFAAQLARQLLATVRREERLRETLRWYADRSNYDWEGRLLVNASAPRSVPPLLDRGERARDELYRSDAPAEPPA